MWKQWNIEINCKHFYIFGSFLKYEWRLTWDYCFYLTTLYVTPQNGCCYTKNKLHHFLSYPTMKDKHDCLKPMTEYSWTKTHLRDTLDKVWFNAGSTDSLTLIIVVSPHIFFARQGSTQRSFSTNENRDLVRVFTFVKLSRDFAPVVDIG